MGKNSNVHKRKTFHDADLQREREEEVRRAAKKEKMQAKKLQAALGASAAAKSGPAPMQVERRKTMKEKKAPLRTKLSGVKKSQPKKSTAIHKRQLIRAAKSKVRACPTKAHGGAGSDRMPCPLSSQRSALAAIPPRSSKPPACCAGNGLLSKSGVAILRPGRVGYSKRLEGRSAEGPPAGLLSGCDPGQSAT
eukprot:Transcript_8653.p1 GENE.Transcript_8653~~Transcript_8653.p1  ORF type:complete len:193 (-),score=48.32 Transcript_8653:162-740(-)